MKLSVLIPALLVPLLAVAGVWTGVLPRAGASSTKPPSNLQGIIGGTPEPTPTPIPVDTTDPDLALDPQPSPINAPGYVTARENGIALIQTTRVDSPTHHGWVDITLDLVVKSFVDDPTFTPAITVSDDKTKACFTNTAAQQKPDCLHVQWGSQLQFIAELNPLGATNQGWVPGKAEVWSVEFEVPANALNASLYFGPTKIALALGGQVAQDYSGHVDSQSQRAEPDSNAPPGTDGYFLGKDYGVAVTKLTREPVANEPTWSKIVVDLDVMRYTLDGAMDSPITTETNAKEACFVVEDNKDCLNVLWGNNKTYSAVLSSLYTDAARPWPRAKAWPDQLSFIVPSNVTEATMTFGGHEIHLDLLGESGPSIAWDYLQHYQPLTGLTLHDDGGHSVDLVSIDRDTQTGDVLLHFEAANRSENRDFYPRVTFEGARVSAGGTVFDGMSSVKDGWRPVTMSVQGDMLAPGETEAFTMTLPRIGGNGFAPIAYSDDPPDAMLLRLAADNNALGKPIADDVQRFQPYYISFEKKAGDADATFFYPDLALTNIQLSDDTPTAGDTINVEFSVTNVGPRNAQATTLDFAVDGSVLKSVPVPAIPANSSTTVTTSWTAPLASATLSGDVNPAGALPEAISDNNAMSVTYKGGVLPDLVIKNVSLLAPSGNKKTRFAVEIANQGLGRAGTFQVNGKIAGGSSFFMTVNGLAAGASVVKEFNWTPAMGSNPVALTVDGPDAISESDETNNTANAYLPDLTYGPNTHLVIDDSGQGHVETTVRNVGQTVAPVVTVNMTLDGNPLMGIVNLGPLQPGESVAVRSPEVPTDGRRHFAMNINPDSAIPEARTDNDVLSFTYVAGPLAELSITNASFSPETFKKGDTLTVGFTVENTGERPSNATTLQVWDTDNNVLLGTVDIPVIVNGEARVTKFQWTADDSMSTRPNLKLVIDPGQKVDELDETNNVLILPAS